MERVAVIGPPGSGKTHWLMQCVEQLLIAGVPPDDIGMATFTKVAAWEINSRLSSKFPNYKYFPWVGTLHSLCKRSLAIPTSQLFVGQWVREFGEAFGYTFSQDKLRDEKEEDIEVHDMMLMTDGDWFEHFDNWYRSALLDFDEQRQRGRDHIRNKL